MENYQAPVGEMLFQMQAIAGLDEITSWPAYAEASPDLIKAVLEEAATFAREVLAPLNIGGDRSGVKLTPDGVVTTPGFAEAYRQFVAGGWNTLSCDPDYGGQGLPQVLLAATTEMWNSANMAFALCPLLTSGAIEALAAHAAPELKTRYLAKMVSGEWSGTMNLTEPQAGSDLAAIRSRAERDGAHYRLFGQKIFITWGEHEMAENIVHLALARLPDAPEGVKGISLFLVPKYLVNDDGSLGPRNDVQCVSLEHKLGIHASPTCVMSYGDAGGAIGYLVGEENRGLAHMFTMMNEARQKVAVQGVALAEIATQRAMAYAAERVQGYAIGRKGERVSIEAHPDVRRMLFDMGSQTTAMRALSMLMAGEMDRARHAPSADVRAAAALRSELLTPIFKGWATEQAIEVANLGIQIHGGMGFIEETGAAQYLRDARILSIYEGTTGIQAADLVGRKLAADGGANMLAFIGDMRCPPDGPNAARSTALQLPLRDALDRLEEASTGLVALYRVSPQAALAVSVDYLMLCGWVCGGWLLCRLAAAEEGDEYSRLADYYARKYLPLSGALAMRIANAPAMLADLYPQH